MAIRKRHFIINIIRLILAALFIFSGFVKAVDPWGTAIKFGDYFTAFGMEWLSGAKMLLSIFLSSVELLLGLLLLFNIKVKTTSFFLMVFMAVFTVVALISAITNPVSDCGCFGEAIKLTNWQTFYKNLVFLPLSIILFIGVSRELKKKNCNSEIFFILLLLGISFYPAINSYIHLPVIDFLPFKTGVNIQQNMSVPEGASMGEYKTVLTYKNLESGELHDFVLEDTTWHDDSVWEFVDSRSEEITKGYEPEIGDFTIFSGTENITYNILNNRREVFIFVFENPSEIKKEYLDRIRKTVDFALSTGGRAIYITSGSVNNLVLQQHGIIIDGYNMDATTLKMLLRACNGLVILNEGTIISKWNLSDIPDFGDSVSATAFSIKEKRIDRQKNFIVSLSVITLLLLILYYRACRKKTF